MELKDIVKIYGNGIVANKNISFQLRKGEIHGIVGENGAGKSTLMKILFGMEQPTSGEIFLNGQSMKIESSSQAIDKGIGMVHQHFMLVPSFTVAQNMILGMEPHKGLRIDYDKARQMIKALAEKYNFQLDVDAKVENLSVGIRQKVEILKALLRGAKILILDEPTAVLTPQETEELFVQLDKLRQSGHTIIFISHKLKEVKSICDRVTVIKKGQTQGTYDTDQISESELSGLMVGKNLELNYQRQELPQGEAVLRVEKLEYRQKNKEILKNISFTVKKGRILGVAGVEGNGQKELIELLTAAKKHYGGSILMKGKEVGTCDIAMLRQMGMSYIPEDRMLQGVAAEASIQDNLIANRYTQKIYQQGLFLRNKVFADLAKELVGSYDVVCRDKNQRMDNLSGGNIQKVVVARECSVKPELLIAEQPTRGVDVGAAYFIHQEMLKLRDQNSAILLISADLNEVMQLSDSLIVLFNGEIVAYFEQADAVSEKELGLYMLGLKRQTEAEIVEAV